MSISPQRVFGGNCVREKCWRWKINGSRPYIWPPPSLATPGQLQGYLLNIINTLRGNFEICSRSLNIFIREAKAAFGGAIKVWKMKNANALFGLFRARARNVESWRLVSQAMHVSVKKYCGDKENGSDPIDYSFDIMNTLIAIFDWIWIWISFTFRSEYFACALLFTIITDGARNAQNDWMVQMQTTMSMFWCDFMPIFIFIRVLRRSVCMNDELQPSTLQLWAPPSGTNIVSIP